MCSKLTIVLRITLADTMRSMDVPRDPGSLTRTFPFHITCSPVRVLVCSCSRFTCSLLLYRFGLPTRPWLHFSLMLTPFVSMTRLQSHYSWTHDSSFYLRLVTPLLDCLYLYLGISQFTIYMDEDGDSSLIFDLLCNHPSCVIREIPRTLLVPPSSLVKAIALRLLGVRLLCLFAYR